jgi:7-cyano-7-deazaguanine synthase
MNSSRRLAVLTSGGLDSAVLLAELGRSEELLFPIYVRAGLFWETIELEYLRRYLHELRLPSIQPLTVLDVPVRDLYPEHWSLSGENVPDHATPDSAVYLPGRNVLLLSKALLWCHLNQVNRLCLGTLAGNPFPDATPDFFECFSAAISQAVCDQLRIDVPYRQLHKQEVLLRGRGLPLEWSFSCIRPLAGKHCGRCNKCAERQRAFADLNWNDPTPYAQGEADVSRDP